MFWPVNTLQFSESLLTSRMDSRDRAKRLVEVRQSHRLTLQSELLSSLNRPAEEPRISLNLFRKVSMGSNCVDNDWILLPLSHEQVVRRNFWETEDISKVGVLVPSEFGDVPLRDFLQGQLPLLLFQSLCLSTACRYFLTCALYLLFSCAHSLNFSRVRLVGPFTCEKVLQLSHFELLESSHTFILFLLIGSLDAQDLLVELELLLQYFCL